MIRAAALAVALALGPGLAGLVPAWATPAAADLQPKGVEKREVLGLWDGRDERRVRFTRIHRSDRAPEAPVSYLVDSRWRVEALMHVGGRTRFRAEGFGAGAMSWQMPHPGRFRVTAKRADAADWTAEIQSDALGLLTFALPAAWEPSEVTLAPLSAKG